MTHSLTPVRVQTHVAGEEHASSGERESGHVSVMPEEVLHLLHLQDGDRVVDMTAGGGGHSEAILKAAKTTLVAIDADDFAVERTTKRLLPFGKRVQVLLGNFRDAESLLPKAGVKSIDKVLFDLGWSSYQLAEGKGFSFQTDEPLNMSYGKDPASGFTAREVVNTWEEKVLADAIFGYGEERYARRIAAAIVARREVQPIETTIELVEIIKDAVPGSYRHGRLHPATRTFQALRIAVNDELGSLEMGLRAAWEMLRSGGRIVVISFHSIEDRVVKHLFAEFAKKDGTLLVKKPLVPSDTEIARNPRSRSAKLRAIEKN